MLYPATVVELDVPAPHVSVAECCTAATPVPVTAIVAGDSVALLVIVTVPLSAAAVVGENVRVKGRFCPGVIVTGAVTPLVLKPVPVTAMFEIVRLELPVSESVTLCVPIVSTVTLPKLTLVELTPRTNVAATPVPVRGIAVGEVAKLLTSETLPLTAVVPVGVNCTLKVEEAPAAIFSGKVSPDTLNPVPVGVAAEIVSVALPVFFTVIVWEFVLPSTTLPKLTLDGVKLIRGAGAAAPVPVRLSVVGEPAALLVKTTLPLTAVVPVGANVTVNVLVPPAATFSGVVRPLMVKPVPLMVAWEIVNVALPPFVIVTVFGLLVPSVTVPNATGDGVRLIWGVGAVVPVPVRLSVVGEPAALLVKTTLPLTAVVPVGANVTVNELVPPAAMFSGIVQPLMVKPVPLIGAWVIVSVALPVLVIVTVFELLVPSVTVPNATGEGVRLIWGAGAAAPVPVRLNVVGDPAALLVKTTLPLTAVVPVGANVTVNELVPPAATFSGVVRPLMVKPVPLMVAWEIVNVALPPLVIVTVFGLLVPSVTVPNATGEGLSEICGATPAPVKGRVFGELLALLVSVTLPEAFPVTVGANFTVRVVELPTFTVTGVVIPLSLKPAPLTAT